MSTYDDVFHFLRVIEFTFYTERVCIATHIECTTRSITVFCTDDATDGFDGKVIGIEFVRVAIDVDFTLCSTGDRHCTYTRHTSQRVHYRIVQNLVECRLAFVSLNRQHQDRNHVGTELEDNRCVHFIRKHGSHHVQLVTHVIGQHVDIITEFKFKGNHRNTFGRLGSDVLQVFY